MDLLARLKNSRNTEVRLSEVLRQHNGPIKEILDVEKESARVRGEIEQLEAEQQTLEHRVHFATIDLKLAEEYQAQLSGGNLIPGNSARAPAHLRNRLHRTA